MDLLDMRIDLVELVQRVLEERKLFKRILPFVVSRSLKTYYCLTIDVFSNAWTVNSPTRAVVNGSFSGELDLPPGETDDITNRVDL